MISLTSILMFVHLAALALGVGAATVKVVLLLGCRAGSAPVQAYLEVVRPITRLIVLGLVLMTLSGIGWLLLGYSFTPRLVLKLVLVAAIWVAGPVIDKVVEPRFKEAAQASGEPTSPGFTQAWRRYLAWEIVATTLFYLVIAVWVLG